MERKTLTLKTPSSHWNNSKSGAKEVNFLCRHKWQWSEFDRDLTYSSFCQRRGDLLNHMNMICPQFSLRSTLTVQQIVAIIVAIIQVAPALESWLPYRALAFLPSTEPLLLNYKILINIIVMYIIVPLFKLWPWDVC